MRYKEPVVSVGNLSSQMWRNKDLVRNFPLSSGDSYGNKTNQKKGGGIKFLKGHNPLIMTIYYVHARAGFLMRAARK